MTPNLKPLLKICLTLIFLSVLLSLNPSSAEEKVILNEVLSPYGSSFGPAGNLPVLENFKHTARGKIFHTIIAQEKDTRIEIEIVKPLDENTALKQSVSKYQIIKNLYGPQTIPYPGAITQKTDCPEDKKPIEVNARLAGKPEKVLLANATERYVLGVWEDNLIKQKAAFTVVYDGETDTLYQIMVFYPVVSFDKDKVLDILEEFSI